MQGLSALDADLRDGGPRASETYAVLGEHEMHGGQVCAFADGDGECKSGDDENVFAFNSLLARKIVKRRRSKPEQKDGSLELFDFSRRPRTEFSRARRAGGRERFYLLSVKSRAG